MPLLERNIKTDTGGKDVLCLWNETCHGLFPGIATELLTLLHCLGGPSIVLLHVS